LSPSYAPDRSECKAFIVQTTRNKFSSWTGWEVLNEL
jgi:hypothetical protein